jgi:hypothetical protein
MFLTAAASAANAMAVVANASAAVKRRRLFMTITPLVIVDDRDIDAFQVQPNVKA